jgi:hypothetical protein
VNAFFLNEPLREHYVCDAIINNKRQTKTKTNKKTTKKQKGKIHKKKPQKTHKNTNTKPKSQWTVQHVTKNTKICN